MAGVPKSVELPGPLTIPYVEQGDPAAPTVVLVHAIGDSLRVFEPVLERFPESVHAIALSQRGHGDAARPATGYHPRDFATDLEGFVDALSLGPVVVVGASSGGLVVRRFAIEHPEQTRGLVLLGSPALLKDKPLANDIWASTLANLTDPIDPQFVREFGGGLLFEGVPAALVEALVEESLKVPAHVWRQTFRGLLDDDSLEEIHRIAAPTLILWGDRDGLLPRGDQEMLVAAIRQARLVVYEGAGHLFYLTEPQRVARDIVAFVEGGSLRGE